MKTVAIIPCLNEAKHIGSVVINARRFVDRVLVCDDSSSDDTVYKARAAGARVVMSGNHAHGKAMCIRRGIHTAIQEEHADILVFLDGDGQHDCSDIPHLIAPIHDSKADVALGIRVNRHTMPIYRKFGNQVLTTAFNIGSRVRLPDAMTGFWAVRSSAVPNSLLERGWGLEIELFNRFRSNGVKITTVHVNTLYHPAFKDNSTSHPMKLGVLLLWKILIWRWRCRV